MRRLYIPTIIVACVSCAAPTSTISQTPATPYPTLTPYATYTPYPTYTPFPTYTPYPSVTPMPPSATPTSTKLPTIRASLEDVLTAFREAGLPITDTVVLNAETDPNKLLGRPYQYIAKVDWRDVRVTKGEPGIETGGTMELFANPDDLEQRRTYIDALSHTGLFAQYIYAHGTVLLRISGQLTPDQAKQYQDVFDKLP